MTELEYHKAWLHWLCENGRDDENWEESEYKHWREHVADKWIDEAYAKMEAEAYEQMEAEAYEQMEAEYQRWKSTMEDDSWLIG